MTTTCLPTCLCRCQQIGCGCRESGSTRRTPPVSPTHPCSLCDGGTEVIRVTSPSGAVVLVTKCPRCDTRQCKVTDDAGCGHYEQDPKAQKCSRCGRYF